MAQVNNQVKVLKKGKYEGEAGVVEKVEKDGTITVKLDLHDEPVEFKDEDLRVLC